MLDPAVFARLLAEGESSHLDYKSRQYPWVHATDAEKSELLKDILALANSWRTVDGFILIGVKEVKGTAAVVVGITEHLDDAQLQQFVNSKTNRPIAFSYFEFQSHHVTVGVIRVPVQQRPFWIKKAYGALQADTVYLRRGSSTDIADLAEIYDMGAASVAKAAPVMHVEFADSGKRRLLGTKCEVRREVLLPPDDPLPDLKEPREFAGGLSPSAFLGALNKHYWREFSRYLFAKSAVSRIGFAVVNRSAVVAEDVRLIFKLPRTSSVAILDHFPKRPVRRKTAVHMLQPTPIPIRPARTRSGQVDVTERGDEWHIEVEFTKVQPGAVEWTTSPLLIGALEGGDIRLEGALYSDNLEPIAVELILMFRGNHRKMTFDDLKAADREKNS